MGDDLRLTHSCISKDDTHIGWLIHCPACKNCHLFYSTGKTQWKFTGDVLKPTFRPSMLVFEDKEYLERSNGKHGHRCHSFVTDGKIKFLGDCTHDMKNTTVDLKPF